MKIFTLIILTISIIWGGCPILADKLELNKAFSMKKGDKVKLLDPDNNNILIVNFLGAGSDSGPNDQDSFHAIFQLEYHKFKDEHFFMETTAQKSSEKRFENFVLTLLFSNGINECRLSIKKERIWIIIFKKEVSEKKALSFLKKTKLDFQEGMDSSKGKYYFSQTGPKFMIKFNSLADKTKFFKHYKNHVDIFEIYEPNWHIHKD